MAFELHRTPLFPAIAASAINIGQAVGLNAGDVQRSVLPIATVNSEPLGVAEATAAANSPVGVYDADHVVPVIAGASLGHGADVGVASTNGALGPIAGASGVVKWRVGKALTAAAAGETFSLLVRPSQLSGLA